MDRARTTGETVLSVYSWERPTLSLGRNQTASGRYDLTAIKDRGIDVVRRPTGGRALLHWHEVTYSVTAPIAEEESLNDSYERINRILLDGLSRLGVSASESRGGPRTPLPGELPCFATPAEGELVVEGSKLVGSAQFRENGALLQHGSILIEDDQPIIAALLKPAKTELEPPRAATLTDALGRKPSIEEVANALFESVRALEDRAASPLDEGETREGTARHIEDYENELWTWRR
jgi:lipoate-protein ligase A